MSDGCHSWLYLWWRRWRCALAGHRWTRSDDARIRRCLRCDCWEWLA